MGWLEEWGLKVTSAKIEVEVEAELGNKIIEGKTRRTEIKSNSSAEIMLKKTIEIL